MEEGAGREERKGRQLEERGGEEREGKRREGKKIRSVPPLIISQFNHCAQCMVLCVTVRHCIVDKLTMH